MSTTSPLEGIDASLLLEAHEFAHVGVWTWDLRSDSVQWSDELFRMFGLIPQSIPLTYDTYLSFVHPDDRDRIASIVQSALRQKRAFQFEAHGLTLTGADVHHLGRATVLCDGLGDVTGLMGVCIDVTERVRERHALRRSETHFQSIFEQSAVGLCISDTHRRFTQVNPSFATFLGYTPGELLGRTFIDITHPDDLQLTAEMTAKGDAARSYTYEKRFVRKDGGALWARVSVTRLQDGDCLPAGSIAVTEDITERKLAGQTLESQKELLSRMMDNLPVMVSLFDTKGRPLYLNREWQRVFGWSLDEARAIDLLACVYPDADEAARVRRAIQASDCSWNDYHPRTRSGRNLPSSWACLGLSDGTSLTIGRDMSEQQQLQQRLVQSQKMEALGQLAGGIAHDFNNLLTIISACATFVCEEVGGNSGAVADTREILAAANRAAALTRQLLAFSRRQMLKPEIVDVNASIDEMARTLGRLIGEHIQLEVVPSARNATVEVDVHQLEQVLLNLAVNARDAIRDSGSITIETSNVTLTSDCGEPREHVRISVSDDGCGIDPVVMDRVFEPFFTTKALGKGTGLGLATVHGVVTQSGGRVEIESELGNGTTFHVYLPTTKSDGYPAYDVDDDAPLRGTETVLLVEDESGLRAVAQRVLARLGYNVLAARHGADAARISAEHLGPIHLLITDVVMPRLGGRELAQLLRKQRPGIPVLYVSGYTDDELLQKGILEQGAQLLRKPFMPVELARAARELLDGTLAR